MSRCIEFYEKWERHPNWCEKCTEAVRQIDNYVMLVDELEKRGVPKETTIVGLSEGAARPLFSEKDPEIKEKAIESVKKCLENKKNPVNGKFVKKLTEYDVKSILKQEKRQKNITNLLAKTPLLPESDQIRLLNADFRDVSIVDIPPESVDLILTDPPYATDYMQLWDDLGAFAARVLKPGKFLVSYAGKMCLPTEITALSKSLPYYWTIALVHKGRKNLFHGRNVSDSWKPLLIFQKQPFKKSENIIVDVIYGSGSEKEYHDWEQSTDELSSIIETFTEPTDVVLDPFCGSGTTLVAAKNLGRCGIGIEVDVETYKIAKARVADRTASVVLKIVAEE